MSNDQESESTVSRSQFIKEEEMAKEKEAPKKVSRKEFVKGAAAVASVGALASCAPAATPAPAPTCPPAPECPPAAECAPCPTPWLPEKWDYEADVVVVGEGFAGQTAAIEADRAGASVLVLEKAPEKYAGGNSRVCGQGFVAPSPAIWDAYSEYLEAATAGVGFPVPDGWIKFFIEESYKSIEWFEDMGAEVIPSPGIGTPGSWIPFFPHFPGADIIATETGCYRIGGEYSGPGGNWYFLDDWIKERPGIKEMYLTPAKRLVQDPVTKAILGVVAEEGGTETVREDGGRDVVGGTEIYVKAKRAVCICSGGYEFDQQMQRDFVGIARNYSWGTPFNTGEGLKMCMAVGANLRNMGTISAPTFMNVGPKPEIKCAPEIMMPTAGAAILVGANNKRWRDEYRPVTGGISNKEIAGLETSQAGHYGTAVVENGVYVRDHYPMPMHMILDEEARLSGPLFAYYAWAKQMEGYACSPDNSWELEHGWIVKADSISDLVTKLGREPDPLFGRVPLEDTINRWNEFCAAGRDLDFDTGDPLHVPYGRKKELLKPIPLEGTVYAIEIFPGCINTQGGPTRNTEAQVLNIEGKPIPRLYSAGELGGFWTLLYQCMSNVGADCYGWGRVAGQNGAAEEPWD